MKVNTLNTDRSKMNSTEMDISNVTCEKQLRPDRKRSGVQNKPIDARKMKSDELRKMKPINVRKMKGNETNIIFQKGEFSQSPDVVTARCVSKLGYPGGILLTSRENGCNDYELHIGSDAEAPKLTSLVSSLWEMRQHVLMSHAKCVMIKKSHFCETNWDWTEIEKCLIECVKGTNIKIIICEV